jgi:nicotinamidase-related amidase
MTTLEKRPNTALVVIDVQNGVVKAAYERDAVVANIASLVDKARRAVLSGLGAGRLVVTGAQTDACVRSKLHGAFVRGYDATLVSDAHTTEDHTEWGAPPPDQVIAHTNLYWTYQTAPGRTVATKDVDLGGAS